MESTQPAQVEPSPRAWAPVGTQDALLPDVTHRSTCGVAYSSQGEAPDLRDPPQHKMLRDPKGHACSSSLICCHPRASVSPNGPEDYSPGPGRPPSAPAFRCSLGLRAPPPHLNSSSSAFLRRLGRQALWEACPSVLCVIFRLALGMKAPSETQAGQNGKLRPTGTKPPAEVTYLGGGGQ